MVCIPELQATQPLPQTTPCKTLQIQKQSLAQQGLLRLRSCLQREEQGMPESKKHWPACSNWAFPHTSHPRDTHQLILLLQITREIQFP